ncbi:MAG TPA: LysR family transcriptional regulator [Reyranella sp.]|jgi:DNA-binding transcriptional LysR family regulator|nr:LysR family transcriptional regulator [Reyranella sp.]
MINLSRIDLNLLVVLETIVAEGGVSRAAERLNLTQPAVSHALGRLRALFGDPLFVRRGRTLAPTALTKSLVEPLRQALRSMAAVLAAGGRFDPRETAASFTVAMRDPLEQLVLPPLARKLSRDAPRIDLRCVQARRRNVEAALADGTLDAAIDVALAMSDSVRRTKVAADGFVVVARKGHPALRGGLALAAYLRLEHVMVSSRRRGPAPEDLGLGQLGHHRRVRLRCRNYGAAFRIVQETDFLLTMPARYAGLLNERAGHRLLKLPFAMPTLDLYLYWHEAAHDDPANRWLRAQLLEVLGKSTSVSKTAR